MGLLTRNDLIRALKQLGPDARVSEAMTATIPTVGHRRCLEDAFRLLQEKSTPAVGVVDSDGRLIGLVTSETVGEMLMVHEALPRCSASAHGARPAGEPAEGRREACWLICIVGPAGLPSPASPRSMVHYHAQPTVLRIAVGPAKATTRV